MLEIDQPHVGSDSDRGDEKSDCSELQRKPFLAVKLKVLLSAARIIN
jgi:hypothetical protein